MPTVLAIRSEAVRAKMRGPRPSMAGSNNPMYGKHRTQEVKDAISKAQTERFKDPEERRKLSDLNKGKTQSEETKHKKSEALKGRPAWNKGKHHTEEAKRKISLAQIGNHRGKGRHIPLEVRQKISNTEKVRYRNPDERLRDSRAVKAAYEKDPSLRVRQSLSHKKLWQDPYYKERALKAILLGAHKRPTKPEKRLTDILERYLPEYEYNGDFGLGIILASLIPDFINVNGKKEIIEVFGDYWHDPTKRNLPWYATELGRIMAYQAIGYKCLIIWEHELKELSEEQLIKKIKTFFRKRKHACYIPAQ